MMMITTTNKNEKYGCNKNALKHVNDCDTIYLDTLQYFFDAEMNEKFFVAKFGRLVIGNKQLN